MDLATLAELNDARRARRAVVVSTDLDGGGTRLIREGQGAPGALVEAVAKALRTGLAATVEVDGRAVFLNPHLPPPRIVAIGAVHITQALAPMAAIAGYDIEIIDPRTAFATPERFHGVRLFPDWPETVLAERPLDAYTALAAVTHDPKIDDFALKAALDAGCFYVGALGSRKTHARRVERLMAMGFVEKQIARINAPIGLDIGASSPAEIAISIMAQIIAAFRSRATGGDQS